MTKEVRVLLVKINLGRGTARKVPLNQDQITNLFCIEEKGDGHGFTIEMVPAIKKYGRYYRVIKMPDGTEIEGDVFFRAKHYTELSDSNSIREGISNFIAKVNRECHSHMKVLQKSQKCIERYFESFV
jgi:hypothetical protein